MFFTRGHKAQKIKSKHLGTGGPFTSPILTGSQSRLLDGFIFKDDDGFGWKDDKGFTFKDDE